MSYTKLFQSIITSSLWNEDDATRIVWITMLACADKHGEVQGSVPGLARIAGVSLPACQAAINKFLAPDPYSRSKDDEGRRIEAIEGGWHLLNHAKYRRLASKEEQIEANAERQRRYREKLNRNASNAFDAKSNAKNAKSNTTVTHDRDIAEADTDSKAEAEAEADTNTESESKLKTSSFINKEKEEEKEAEPEKPSSAIPKHIQEMYEELQKLGDDGHDYRPF